MSSKSIARIDDVDRLLRSVCDIASSPLQSTSSLPSVEPAVESHARRKSNPLAIVASVPNTQNIRSLQSDTTARMCIMPKIAAAIENGQNIRFTQIGASSHLSVIEKRIHEAIAWIIVQMYNAHVQ